MRLGDKSADNAADCPCKDQTGCIASIHPFPAASKGEDLAKVRPPARA
jgi:hypothetical protein